MSLFNTAWGQQPPAPQSRPSPARFGAVVALALASGVAAGPAVADPQAALAKPVMNFVATTEHPEARQRPASSLWAKLQQAEPAQQTIEPTAATPSRRALAHDVAPEEELADIPDPLAPDVYDPLEPVNRLVFGINEIVDFVVLRPVSLAYRTLVPQHLRTGVNNALHNWSTPVVLANDLLQGRPDKAKKTFVRFLVNSTAGFGGIVDAAAAAGMPRHSEDFGQTLAVWGLESGPYVVLPLLGPSNFRDTIGLAVDTVTHPATWLMWDLQMHERTAPVMAWTVSTHEGYLDEFDALRSTSPDFYATIRGVYAQRRATEIADGSLLLEPVDGSQGGGDIDSIDLESLPPIPTE